MRVHVDPAGRDQKPVGVDIAPGRALLAADRDDLAVRNRNIAAECGFSAAIDDAAAANNDVMHGRPPGCCGAIMPADGSLDNAPRRMSDRSEEHTSELQSPCNLV